MKRMIDFEDDVDEFKVRIICSFQHEYFHVLPTLAIATATIPFHLSMFTIDMLPN